MSDDLSQLNFEAAARLYKWPSLGNLRREDRAPYMIAEGTLDECIRDFMAKPERSRHLYEIRTAPQTRWSPMSCRRSTLSSSRGCGISFEHATDRKRPSGARRRVKAAPTPGAAAATINVGHPVTGAMIPLPSSLTEKVPRLVGARFATRNGTIIISTRNSRRVDAVLPPN